MTVYEAVKERHTIRKFKQEQIARADLLQIVDCARLAPYGANAQPLKYAIVTEEEKRRSLYPLIKYAGFLRDWDPAFEECPPTFIVICNDTSIKPTDRSECDSGAALVSMCLAAQELGYGSVCLGAINRPEIKRVLGLAEQYDVTYLLGIGRPAQTGETFDFAGDLKYYFDDNGNVHVPKRTMEEVLIKD
ncbi:MAG: nitroreductase family protein [Lachnospiraceae bacterium]|nr:nitroreductase family protein [Lachnospiraceae bacterium]